MALGAGAGAAKRIEFEEKLEEEQRQADMRAAQNAAQMQMQNAQFKARMAADADARKRAEALSREERDYRRGRDAATDARQQRLEERQDRLDALALEERDYRRGRDAAADARADRAEARQSRLDERQSRLDEMGEERHAIDMEQRRAYLERQNALDEEVFAGIRKRKEQEAARKGLLNDATERLVNFAIGMPDDFRNDPSAQMEYLDSYNKTVEELTGKNPGITRIQEERNGARSLWSAVRDGDGNVVGENFVGMLRREQIDAVAEKYGKVYDPRVGAFVDEGATAWAGKGSEAGVNDSDTPKPLWAEEGFKNVGEYRKSIREDIKDLEERIDMKSLDEKSSPEALELKRLRKLLSDSYPNSGGAVGGVASSWVQALDDDEGGGAGAGGAEGVKKWLVGK